MPCFEDLFVASKGKPIVFNGRTLQLFDRIAISDNQEVTLKFESIGSDWRQGVRISTDGSFEINNQKIRKSIVLWHDTAPPEVALRVHTNSGELRIINVWDTGTGLMQSGHNGAAMIVQLTPHGRRYQCNDGHPDEDFDDLIFILDLSERQIQHE